MRSRTAAPTLTSTSITAALSLFLTLSGCEEPYNVKGAKKAAAKPELKTREILGNRTQDVKDVQAELQTGKAKVAGPRKVAKDPITLSGNVYVSAIGRTTILNIKHAVDLHHASTGDYPKTYQEFMEVIIKANNIALPTLPYYQEWGYDSANHALTILEYPDKKEALEAQENRRLGRE